jgi:hypothetical protein
MKNAKETLCRTYFQHLENGTYRCRIKHELVLWDVLEVVLVDGWQNVVPKHVPADVTMVDETVEDVLVHCLWNGFARPEGLGDERERRHHVG